MKIEYGDTNVGNISEQEANDFISSIIIGELGFKKCWIVMEAEGEDTFGAAFFLNTVGKNYYIEDKSRNIVIKHGVATKSSSKARIVDKSTDEIVSAMLSGGISSKNEKMIKAIDESYDTSKWTVKDIMQGVHVRKASDYKKGNPIGLTIGKLAQQRWKIPESNLDGMQFTYIKLRGKSNYAVVSDVDKLSDFAWDKDYYMSIMDRILKSLGLEDFHPRNRTVVRTVQKDITSAWG